MNMNGLCQFRCIDSVTGIDYNEHCQHASFEHIFIFILKIILTMQNLGKLLEHKGIFYFHGCVWIDSNYGCESVYVEVSVCVCLFVCVISIRVSVCMCVSIGDIVTSEWQCNVDSSAKD